MTYEEYATIGAVNFSTLKHFARSPMHYKAALAGPDKKTDAMAFGNVLHKLVFEGDKYLPLLKIGPTKSRDTIKWREMEQAEPDAILVTEDEQSHLIGMAKSIYRNKTAMGYIRGGATEVTVEAVCDVTGLPLKARMDLLAADGKTILDLKSCLDARVGQFENDITKYLYYRQAAFYKRVCELAGLSHRNFLFLALEKKRPYCSMLHALDPCSFALGMDQNAADLKRLKVCRETNEWPGYSEEVQIVSVKPWAIPMEDE